MKSEQNRADQPNLLMKIGVPETSIRAIGHAMGDVPVVKLVESLLNSGIEESASDIHFEPKEQGMRVRYRVDGCLIQMAELKPEQCLPVVSRIKVMANLDIAERRLSQDGRITYKTGGRTLDLRVSTIATIFGEKVVVRVFDQECIAQYDLKKLGFDGKNLMLFNKFLNYSCGMVLVTGPTGSGKSTTLYTAMRILNSLEKNLVTVEDPVEYQLPGVNQTQVNAKAGVTFATYLRSIVRQDPDVIMVGEIRDLETAQMAVRAASTGHLVLSTLHTNDASGSLSRLVDMGIEPVMVASSVLGVVTQRLVRRICLACREPYYPDEQELAFAGITSEQGQFLTGGGCELCNRTGYRGRVAISEVLAVTPKLRSLIIARAASEVLREVALQEGMVPIETDGVRKALQGITTIKEVMRATFR